MKYQLTSAFVLIAINLVHAQWTGQSSSIDLTSQIYRTGVISIDAYNAAQVRLNSSGTYYGKIGNPAPQVWSLGWGGPTNDINPVLNWTASGSVGIGTTSPLNILDVNGIARFRRLGSTTAGATLGGDALALRGWGANNPYIEWRNSTDVRQGYMGWNTNRLSLVMENGYNFTVENGNVGIGTANPDAKLAVKGTVHANEVKVDLLGAVAPDYVFDKDYNLPTLESIKTYIDQNKHLPEVPSAKEMEVNGINLGEMNMLLLKKVEELMLYVIEQNKSTEKFEKENDDLKERILELEKLIKK